MSYNIKGFQKRYGLSNKEMADICGCSLPTIQKWRSGEVAVSGAATQLMRVLDLSAEGHPARLREVLTRLNHQVRPLLEVPDKELVELESSMSRMVDRLELMLEARRREKKLMESEARYRSMVESQKSPVCRWLPDTTLTYVNRAYADLFSQFWDNLMGRKWLEFIPEEKRSSLAAIVSDIVRRGEEEVYTHESIDKDGRIRIQQWRDIPVKDGNGNITEFHSIGADVTEVHSLKKELSQLRQSMKAMMETCPSPVLVFDEKGNLLEMSEKFRSEILGGEAWENIADMMPGFPARKFARLLGRLLEGEELCYRMEVGGRPMLLKARITFQDSQQSRFLAAFQELEEAVRNPVMQVRLRNELLIDGKGCPFLIDPAAADRIRESMQALGRRLQVDRIYVFTFDYREEVFDNVLEWCAEGIPSHIKDLKRIPFDEYPWWNNRLMKDQWIQVEETHKMPRKAAHEMEILLAQGIQAVLVAPLNVAGRVIGFVGFDNNTSPRIWHEQEIRALREFKGEMESVLASSLGAL